MPKSMPSYLRIDNDIKEGLLIVQKLIKAYADFDSVAIEHKMARLLELELDKQSTLYKQHKTQVATQLQAASDQLEQCILLKNQNIEKQVQLLDHHKSIKQDHKDFLKR